MKLLALGFSIFDVVSDVLNGLNYFKPRNVTKLAPNTSDEIPDNCEPVTNSSEMICQETDAIWGFLTLSCIQLPGIVICIFLLPTHNSDKHYLMNISWDNRMAESRSPWIRLLQVTLLLVPYPLIAWVQLIRSIFINKPLNEHFSALLMFGEGALESAPQLILQIYIIITDKTRTTDPVQIVAICTSFVCIAKTAMEMYATRSGNYSYNNPTTEKKDSMLEDRSMLQKIWILIKISPAFLTSLLFKVFSKV